MSDKISLEKNCNSAEIQEINQKLDFLIGEVKSIRHDMKELQSQNTDKLYQLDSRFYQLCSDLQSQIYKFQSEFYSGNQNISRELKELQEQTTYSRFMDKVLPLTPAFLIGGMVWLFLIAIILD